MNGFLRKLAQARSCLAGVLAALLLCISAPMHAQTVPPTTLADTNYSSLWWVPAESGWGTHITHQGNNIFLALYTYDADGQPMWLVCSACAKQVDGKTFTGDFFRVVNGTPFNVSPFVPIASSNISVVGTMMLSFASADTGTMTYSVNGTTVVKSIQKQLYGKATAKCVFQASADRSALTNYQDLWWSPSESGWGISLVHQDDILFAALFVYSETRRDEWYVMSNGPKQADGSFLGDLYRVTGPPFNASPFVPLGPDNQASRLTKVGTMSVRFSSGEAGTLTYVVNGVTVVKNIIRQVFGSPSNACRQSFPPKLLALIQGNLTNGYVDIDLSTFTGVQKNPGGSFYGADYDASSNNIVLSSAFSGSTQPYSFVSAVTGAVSAGLNIAQQGAQVAPVKCEPSNSVRPGLCYYGFGNNFDGRVVIGSGRNVVETVTLPDASLGRIPTQFAIIGNTLVVKTLSPAGTTDVLHTLNLGTTPRTWGTPIALPIKANGIDVKGNNVYVTGFTIQFVRKVVRVDITTGTVQDLNLSLESAGDIALSEDTLFVSTLDKVRAFRLSDNALLGDTLLPGAEKMVYFGGNLYVSNPAGSLYKMDAVTRLKVNEMSIPLMKSGELVIIAP